MFVFYRIKDTTISFITFLTFIWYYYLILLYFRMWKDLTKTCQKDSCLKEWELEKILEVRPCLFIQKLFQFYPDFIQILSRFFQTFSKAHFTHIFVLSVGYTETKYIKLKTKNQIPNFLLFFIKNSIVILAFFETI